MYTCPCRAKTVGKSVFRGKKTVQKVKSRKPKSRSVGTSRVSRGKSKVSRKSKSMSFVETKQQSVKRRKSTLSCPMPRRIIPILKYK